MGFGYGGGGGGVSDAKDIYTIANAGVTLVAGDSPYTVTDTGSVIVYVDSSAGAVTINPNASPEAEDRLKVIDVGDQAGTNTITITGLGEIQTDGGAREYGYIASVWKQLEATREILARNASTGEITALEPDTLVANRVESESAYLGSAATVKSTLYAGFGNIGANVDSDGTSHGNVLVYANATDTDTLIGSSGWLGGTTANLFDGVNSTIEQFPATAELEFDGGTIKDYSRFDFWDDVNGATRMIGTFELLSSTDGVSWSTEQTLDNSSNQIYSQTVDKLVTVDFDTITTRYIKIIFTSSSSSPLLGEFNFYTSSFATTTNTIETTDTDTGITVAPASCKVYDEAGLEITADTVNLEYTTDNGSSWSGLVALSVFQALGNIVSAGIFNTRIQAIEEQRVSKFDRAGSSAGLNSGASGFDYSIDGIPKHEYTEALGLVVDGANLSALAKIEPTALTADTLLDDTDGTVLLDPSGADFTMTLPAVATVAVGKKYTFVLTTAPATTAVTLDGDGSETINGATTNATALTAQWDTVTIMSDGTQWIVIGQNP